MGPGFIVITNGYRVVQPIVALKPGATGDITLKPGETKNQFIAWSMQRGGPYIPTPVIYQDQLYVIQGNGVLQAYKVATGERIYQERLGGTGGSFSASLVAGGRQDLRDQRGRRRLRRQGGPGLRAAVEEPGRRGPDGHAGDLGRPDHLPRPEARHRDTASGLKAGDLRPEGRSYLMIRISHRSNRGVTEDPPA